MSNAPVLSTLSPCRHGLVRTILCPSLFTPGRPPNPRMKILFTGSILAAIDPSHIFYASLSSYPDEQNRWQHSLECSFREQVCTFVRRIHSSSKLTENCISLSSIPACPAPFSSSSLFSASPVSLSSPFFSVRVLCIPARLPHCHARSRKSLFPLMCVFSIPKRADCETGTKSREGRRRKEAGGRQR